MLPPIEELENALSRLPGFGRRSASRAALALVREPSRLLAPLLSALVQARDGVRTCSHCGAFTVLGRDPCSICSDPLRDNSILCVVEDPADIVLLEATGAFRGRYHALGGKISPSHRMDPSRLRIAELVSRAANEGVGEVFLALSTDMEGDATTQYIAEKLSPLGVKTTRLAFGLPADSAVAYSDALTLRRAIQGRRDV